MTTLTHLTKVQTVTSCSVQLELNAEEYAALTKDFDKILHPSNMEDALRDSVWTEPYQQPTNRAYAVLYRIAKHLEENK